MCVCAKMALVKVTVDVKLTIVVVVDRSRKMRRHDERASRLLELVRVNTENKCRAGGQSCNGTWPCWWPAGLGFGLLCSASAFCCDGGVVMVESALLTTRTRP